MKCLHPRMLILSLAVLVVGCAERDSRSITTGPQVQDTTEIDLWNGNRSLVRQAYEREVLEAVLTATEDDFGPWQIDETLDDYPGDEEALVFTEKGHDVFVTIAGNQKFGEDDSIVIPHMLAKNLLGHRIPIIREQDVEKFAAIRQESEIQELVHGIPRTWSDAVVFRENGYQVLEEGTFDDIFDRLQNGLFDYSAYGANEVIGIYKNRASRHEGLTIDDNLLLFYQFPLVFYVNPNLPDLAERIETGMQRIIASGRLDELFDSHYGEVVAQLNLERRTLFVLDNPLIPEQFADLRPNVENLME
jgi:hypothetical protein